MDIPTVMMVQMKAIVPIETSFRIPPSMIRTSLSRPQGTKLRLLSTLQSQMLFPLKTETMCSRLNSGYHLSGWIRVLGTRISGVGLRPCCLNRTRPRYGLQPFYLMIWTNLAGLLQCFPSIVMFLEVKLPYDSSCPSVGCSIDFRGTQSYCYPAVVMHLANRPKMERYQD